MGPFYLGQKLGQISQQPDEEVIWLLFPCTASPAVCIGCLTTY